MVGYGLEQYSDVNTRRPGATPSDSDFDPLTDASLTLTQVLWDGGEISQDVSVKEALLETAAFQIEHARQLISIDAVTAHLEVYRQRELAALAEKNYTFHEKTFKSLSEMERAGAGNIADVTQARARMAGAKSELFSVEADLNRAVISYKRMTGTKPAALSFAEVPPAMPESLENALRQMEKTNPELLIYNARQKEFNARFELANAIDRPKVNLELRSRYADQLEGDTSWQHTNEAKVVLYWNLFNGGQNKQMIHAALSRKYQEIENRKNKFIELKENLSGEWATYLSLLDQKKITAEAKEYSQKIFEIYLEQFGISRRDLLDVLGARYEYFQSARQLINTDVNLSISAYRILMLTGNFSIGKER